MLQVPLYPLTCHVMSTVDHVKTISAGSLSPGCGGDNAGWVLPLTEDFTDFLGQRFAGTWAILAAVWWRKLATVRCLELLDVELTALLKHDVVLWADTSLFSPLWLLLTVSSEWSYKVSTYKSQHTAELNWSLTVQTHIWGKHIYC